MGEGKEGLTYMDTIAGRRPFMNAIETVVADWMMGVLSGTDTRSLVQFADDQGISKGYASKLRAKLAEKVKKPMTSFSDIGSAP